jgi:hypothetical protein
MSAPNAQQGASLTGRSAHRSCKRNLLDDDVLCSGHVRRVQSERRLRSGASPGAVRCCPSSLPLVVIRAPHWRQFVDAKVPCMLNGRTGVHHAPHFAQRRFTVRIGCTRTGHLQAWQHTAGAPEHRERSSEHHKHISAFPPHSLATASEPAAQAGMLAGVQLSPAVAGCHSEHSAATSDIVMRQRNEGRARYEQLLSSKVHAVCVVAEERWQANRCTCTAQASRWLGADSLLSSVNLGSWQGTCVQ